MQFLSSLSGWGHALRASALNEAFYKKTGIDPACKLAFALDQMRFVAQSLTGDSAALNAHLNAGRFLRAAKDHGLQDFGHGNFYTSLDKARLSGRRSTEARIASMGLKDIVTRKTVLDIGACNGFVSLSLAAQASTVVCVEPNRNQLAIGDLYAHHLDIRNVRFTAERYEDAYPQLAKAPFDVVLSLSNHFTVTEAIFGDVGTYFDKTKALLSPHGTLVVESYPAAVEAQQGGIDALRNRLTERFDIVREGDIAGTRWLDKGRRYFVCRNKPANG